MSLCVLRATNRSDLLLPVMIDYVNWCAVSSQSHVLTSNRKRFRPNVAAQQPKDNDPFKIHLKSPSLATGERRGLRTLTPILRPTSEGRLRAKLPTAPNPLLENRHTVRLQDRDERPRQWVINTRVSVDRQSLSPRKRQEPHKRIWAVLWSSLSHNNSKATRDDTRISLAHSNSSWR